VFFVGLDGEDIIGATEEAARFKRFQRHQGLLCSPEFAIMTEEANVQRGVMILPFSQKRADYNVPSAWGSHIANRRFASRNESASQTLKPVTGDLQQHRLTSMAKAGNDASRWKAAAARTELSNLLKGNYEASCRLWWMA
jgi:hypothetical protein